MPDLKKTDVDAMKLENEQLKETVDKLAGDINSLMRAQVGGMSGYDPGASARMSLPRKYVQFTDNYNRLVQPSTVKGAGNIVEGYCVSKHEIVNLRQDEIERLNKDRPGLLITNREKFVERVLTKATPGTDNQGRFKWNLSPDPISVKDLIERAENAG